MQTKIIKIVKNKYLILVVLFIIFILLTSIGKSFSISNRAMIVGVSIDKEEQGIKVCAQILSVSNNDSNGSGGDSSLIICGYGETVGEAFCHIDLSSGGFISLGHCKIIIIGEELAKIQGMFDIFDFITRNYKMTDDTTCVVSAGRAEDILARKGISIIVSSFAIKGIIINASNYAEIAITTVQSYMTTVLNGSKTVTMPYITVTEDVEEQNDSVSNGEPKVVFDLISTACLTDSSLKLILGQEDSKYLLIVTKDFDRGRTIVKVNNENRSFGYSRKKTEINIELDGNRPIVNVEIDITFVVEMVRGLYKIEPIDYEAGKIIESETEAGLISVYNKGKVEGLDLYNLYSKYYKKYGKKLEEIYKTPQELLEAVEIETKVKVNLRN